MRRCEQRFAVVLAVALMVSASASAAMQRGATAPAPQAAAPQTAAAAAPSPERVKAGATLYRKTGCFQCHVNEGQGGANGPRIGPNPIPFAAFTRYVRRPTGEMPPYTAKVLTDQDLSDIYAFLQTRPRPPAVNTIPQLAP